MAWVVVCGGGWCGGRVVVWGVGGVVGRVVAAGGVTTQWATGHHHQ